MKRQFQFYNLIFKLFAVSIYCKHLKPGTLRPPIIDFRHLVAFVFQSFNLHTLLSGHFVLSKVHLHAGGYKSLVWFISGQLSNRTWLQVSLGSWTSFDSCTKTLLARRKICTNDWKPFTTISKVKTWYMGYSVLVSKHHYFILNFAYSTNYSRDCLIH